MNEKSNIKELSETKATIMVGRIASVLSIVMYVSYVAQISNNLQGVQYNHFVLPLIVHFGLHMV